MPWGTVTSFPSTVKVISAHLELEELKSRRPILGTYEYQNNVIKIGKYILVLVRGVIVLTNLCREIGKDFLSIIYLKGGGI